jgi:hypothetical protein
MNYFYNQNEIDVDELILSNLSRVMEAFLQTQLDSCYGRCNDTSIFYAKETFKNPFIERFKFTNLIKIIIMYMKEN